MEIFGGEIVGSFLLLLWVAACFVVFDAFHITDMTIQVLIAVAPFLALAFYLVRSGKIKR